MKTKSEELATTTEDTVIDQLKDKNKDLYAKITALDSGCFGLTTEEVLNRLCTEKEGELIKAGTAMNLHRGSLYLRDLSGIGLYTLAYHLADLWSKEEILQEYKAVIVMPIEQVHRLEDPTEPSISNLFKVWGIDIEEATLQKEDILVIISGYSEELRLYEEGIERREAEESYKNSWLEYIKEFNNIIITNKETFLEPNNVINVSLEPYYFKVEHLRGTQEAKKCYIPAQLLIKEAIKAIEQKFFKLKYGENIGEIKTTERWHEQFKKFMEEREYSIPQTIITVDHKYPALTAQNIIRGALGEVDNNAIALSTPAEWFCAAVTPGYEGFAAYSVSNYFIARNLKNNYVDNIGVIENSVPKLFELFPGVKIIFTKLINEADFDSLEGRELITRIEVIKGAIQRDKRTELEELGITQKDKKTIDSSHFMSKTEHKKFNSLKKLIEDPGHSVNGAFKNFNNHVSYGQVRKKALLEMDTLTDVTSTVRQMLKGDNIASVDNLVLGMSAVMLAETSRCPLTFLVTLCMLDLIETGDREKDFWKLFFAPEKEVDLTLSGIEKGLMLDVFSTIGGLHPMSQGNSYYQARNKDNNILQPSLGMDLIDFKSHIILMKWLTTHLEKYKDITPHVLSKVESSVLENEINLVDDIFLWFANAKLGHLNPHIFDRFYTRLDSFDLMLNEERSLIRLPEDHFENPIVYLGSQVMSIRAGLVSESINRDIAMYPSIVGRIVIASKHFKDDSFDKAIKIYLSVLVADPEFYQINFFISMAYFKKNINFLPFGAGEDLDNSNIYSNEVINKSEKGSSFYYAALFQRIQCNSYLINVYGRKELLEEFNKNVNEYIEDFKDKDDPSYYQAYGYRALINLNEENYINVAEDFEIYKQNYYDLSDGTTTSLSTLSWFEAQEAIIVAFEKIETLIIRLGESIENKKLFIKTDSEKKMILLTHYCKAMLGIAHERIKKDVEGNKYVITLDSLSYNKLKNLYNAFIHKEICKKIEDKGMNPIDYFSDVDKTNFLEILEAYKKHRDLDDVRLYIDDYLSNLEELCSPSFHEVNCLTDIRYNNPILNNNIILQITFKLYGKENLNLLIKLGEDKVFAEQALILIDKLGEESFLKTLFSDQVKTSKVESQQSKASEITLKINIEEIFKKIVQIEAVIGKEALSELTGWHQFISNALSNNPFSGQAVKVIQIIDNLTNSLEEYLDFGSLYESIDIDTQVTIIYSQLEYWIGFAASGVNYVGLPPRYPGFDPDDDGGSGGDSSSEGNDSKDINMFLAGQNYTVVHDD